MRAPDPTLFPDGKTSDSDASGQPTTLPPPNPPKSLSFHMSFLALNIMVFIVSLDATILAVAIPVMSPPPLSFLPRII